MVDDSNRQLLESWPFINGLGGILGVLDVSEGIIIQALSGWQSPTLKGLQELCGKNRPLIDGRMT